MINPCNVLDALADFQYTLINRLNKKFEQLRRLAALLEQLGDLSTLAPNLNALIPILDIDFNVYNQLAGACPFLGLPQPPVEGDLNTLRQQVLTAYDNYARQILNHPFLRMGKVQEQLTKYQAMISKSLGVGLSYIQCLQAMCAAGSALGSAVSKLSQTDLQKTISDYTTNFVTNGGSVLTEPMKAKYLLATDALGQMQGLGSSVGKDYAVLSQKAAVVAATVTPPPAGTTFNNPPFASPTG